LKRLITAILLFTAFNFGDSVLLAQQSNFDRATDQLQQQNYRDAITLYQEIADEDYRSGALWFNLGIAYTQLDSLGLAKYYFLKSSQFPETEPEARSAIEYVNDRFSRRSAVLPPLPWERFSNYLKNEIGVNSLFSSGLIFLYLGIAGILLFWFYSKFRSYSYYSGITAILMSALLFATAFYVQYLENRYGTGVVIDRQSVVYQSPDSSSAEISTAFEGYTLRVDYHASSEHQDWIYIRLENGMKGWLNSHAVKTL